MLPEKYYFCRKCSDLVDEKYMDMISKKGCIEITITIIIFIVHDLLYSYWEYLIDVAYLRESTKMRLYPISIKHSFL
jgi:hypothetical protein